MPDGIVSPLLARQLAEGPMLDGMPAADLYRDTYAEGPMLDGMSQDELYRQSVPRANPYAEGPVMDGLEAERLFRQSRPMGGPEEGPLLDGFDARRLFQEGPSIGPPRAWEEVDQRGPVQMTPSRGHTLGEAVLGGARAGARGGSVMGAPVRGMGAGNAEELSRLNREFMIDRARREAMRNPGSVSLSDLGGRAARRLSEEGTADHTGLGRYLPYGRELPYGMRSHLEVDGGAMRPVTLRSGEKVISQGSDLIDPGQLSHIEGNLADQVLDNNYFHGADDNYGGRYMRDSSLVRNNYNNPQFYDQMGAARPISDIDLAASGISPEVDSLMLAQQRQNRQRWRNSVWDANPGMPRDNSTLLTAPTPSRMSRFGSALKTGLKGALTPANIVKDAIGGTILGGLSAGAGHLAGRPTSAGQLSLPEGSPLLDAAGDGPVDQATMLRIIEAQAQRKEALRSQYINEINSRLGVGTVGPGARMEEIVQYLPGIAPINR